MDPPTPVPLDYAPVPTGVGRVRAWWRRWRWPVLCVATLFLLLAAGRMAGTAYDAYAREQAMWWSSFHGVIQEPSTAGSVSDFLKPAVDKASQIDSRLPGALRSWSPRVRLAAARATGPTAEYLEQLATSTNPRRGGAIDESNLPTLFGDRTRDALLDVLISEPSAAPPKPAYTWVEAAVSALTWGCGRDPSVLRRLNKVWPSIPARRRQELVRLPMTWGPRFDGATDLLIVALADPDAEVREAAANAVAEWTMKRTFWPIPPGFPTDRIMRLLADHLRSRPPRRTPPLTFFIQVAGDAPGAVEYLPLLDEIGAAEINGVSGEARVAATNIRANAERRDAAGGETPRPATSRPAADTVR